MKKIFMIAVLALFFGGCSGYLYTDKPALEFQDIDYGFPVKTALKNPSIAYIDYGKGEKTLVLVHGLASNAGFWRYNIPELAKHYRVIAVDLPGYGKSQKEAYPYNMTFYADEVKRLTDALGIDKFTFVGHSMGGQVGITFALKYPEKLDKLVLTDPAGIEAFQQGEGDWLRSVMTVNGVKKTTEEGIRRNLAQNFYSWSPKWEWMVEERVRMSKARDFDDFAYAVVRSVNGMLDEPTFDLLRNIKTPTLIVYGKYDGLIPNPYLHPGFPKDVFQAGHRLIPGSQLIQIGNAGHMLMIEQPEDYNRTVIDFVK